METRRTRRALGRLALIGGLALTAGLPVSVATASPASAAPTCQQFSDYTSVRFRCKSLDPFTTYRAVAICVNGQVVTTQRYAVGSFNRYGRWAEASCYGIEMRSGYGETF